MSGDTETRAQIVLDFKSRNGNRYSVRRMFSLTTKSASTLSIKTDSVSLILRKPEGDVTHSRTCVDVNRFIPEILGTSKALLDNVIFCHQEESNWPLESTSQMLKKKFDDIFASTRYSKALAQITDEIKNKDHALALAVEQLKAARKDLTVKKEKLDESSKIREEIVQIDRMMERQKDDIDKLTARYKDSVSKRDEVKRLLESIQLLKKEEELFRSHISVELEEDEATIRSMIPLLDAKIEQRKMQLEKLSKEADSEICLLKDAELNLKSAQEQRARLEAELTVGRQSHAEWDRRIIDFLQNFDATTASSSASSSSGTPVTMEDVLRVQKKYESEETAQNQKYRSDVREMQKRSEEASQLVSSLMQKVNVSQDRIDEISQLLNRSESDRLSLGDVHSDMVTILRSQDKVLEAKITDCSSDKEAISAKISRIERRRDYLSRTAETVLQKKHYSELVAGLQEMIVDRQSITASRRQEEKASGIQLSSSSSSSAVQNDIDRALATRTEAETEQRMKEMLLKSEEQTVGDFLSRVPQELRQEGKSQVEDFDNIEETISAFQSELDLLDLEVSNADHMGKVYAKFLDISQKHHACALCSRAFDDDQELSVFVRSVSDKLKKLPLAFEEKRARLSAGRERLRLLNGVISLVESARKSQLAIPALKADIAICASTVETQRSRTVRLQKLKELLEKEERLSEFITKTEKEMKCLEMSLHLAEDDGPASFSSTFPDEQVSTVDEATERLMKLRSEEQEVSRQMESAFRTRSMLDRQIRDAEEKIERKARIQSEIDKLQKEKSNLVQLLSSWKSTALPAAERRRDQVFNDFRCWDAQQQAHLRAFEQRCSNVRSFSAELGNLWNGFRFIRDGSKEEAVRVLETQVTKFAALKAECEQKQTSKDRRVGDLDASIQKAVELRGVAENTLLLYETERSIRRNRATLTQLLFQTLKIQVAPEEPERAEQAGVDALTRLSQEIDQFQVQVQTARDQYEYRRGERTKSQQQLDEILRNLESKDVYRDAEKTVAANQVKVKMLNLAKQDLATYRIALEAALVAFHECKMREVNAFVREIWHSTYTGQDIDNIEIVSTCESGKRTAYKYAVVMRRHGSSLEMRGRCSTGQKVLASIVIRLALARAFSLQCGVLVLDEPTTNLDAQNAASLATGLSTLLRRSWQSPDSNPATGNSLVNQSVRSSGGKMQLVIITHDEDFVQLLGRSEFCDVFYRVSKDLQTESSLIRQHRFSH
eukprot:ANDGO_08011.mRNA.2 DNA repair protein RAD50